MKPNSLKTRTKWFRAALGLFAAFALLIARPAFSGPTADIVMIVNSANPVASLSAAEVKDLYLGEKTQWPNREPVRIYTRPGDSPAGLAFFRDVLQMAPARFRRHWQERTFQGKPGFPPEQQDSPEAIAQAVARSPGGVGFLSKQEAATPPAGVKVLP